MQDEKDIIINDLREEIERMKDHSQEKLNEAIGDTTNIEKQLQDSQDVLSDVKTDLQAEKAKYEALTAEKTELKTQIAELNEIVKQKEATAESYLQQIAKMQELLQETENEIEGIEAGHFAIQRQLEEEIKRMEDQHIQVSADLSRESSSSHAQNILIRTVLQETELGKITMFIVDYFENSKKKSLARETIATELQFAPIIIRKHLRLLHGLGVIVFNEVSGEIKLVKA
jgi:chromosome segregation ATPase